MKRRLLALLLVVSLVASMCTTAFAGNFQEGDGGVKYVSLGDSMTNGYGLPGYDGNTGVEDYGKKSYANLFAEWLNGEPDHAQLAMSAMRAEDLHWLLEVNYKDPAVHNVISKLEKNGWDEELWYSVFTNGDYWTWAELVNDYRFDVAAYCIKGKDETDGGIFNEGNDEYPNGYKVAYDEYTDVEALQVVAEYYQTTVTEANVISLSIGNGNFGVFMFGRITEAISFTGSPEDTVIWNIENAIQECDPETQMQVRELMGEVEAILASKGIMADDGDDKTVSTMEALYNVFMYTVVSYALNYAGTVEAILQLNPDAEIIQVALMNTMGNEKIAGETTLSDLMDLIYVPLNAYIAALPTYMQATQNSVYADATFYYAEADYVECIVDTYESPLSGTVRDRFVESIVGGGKGMVWELLGSLVVPVTADEIATYEGLEEADKVGYAAQNADKAKSIAIYLAFEKAVIANRFTPVTVDSILGLGAGFDFEAIMGVYNAQAAVAGKAKYQTVANVLAQGDAEQAAVIMALLSNDDAVYDMVAQESEGMLTAAQVKTLYEGEFSNDAIYAVIAEKSGGMLNAGAVALLDSYGVYKFATTMVDGFTAEEIQAAYENNRLDAETKAKIDGLHQLYNGIQTLKDARTQDMVNDGVDTANGIVAAAKALAALLVTPDVLGDVLSESEMKGLLALFGRCVIGNGIGSHPSADGHDALFEAVMAAYDEEYTSADETKENLISVAEALAALVAEYYDEAYAYAYAEADIDTVIAAIDDVIAELAAIDLSGIEMTDAFRAGAEELKSEIIDTLEEAKALILEADVLDQASMDALLTLLGEAAEDVQALTDLLVQAGVDVNELVIVPALNAAYDKLVNEVIPAAEAAAEEIAAKAYEYLVALAEQAGEDLAEAYDAFVEAFLEFLPEADAWLYDWFYNNPDKVIAFFEENGEFFVEIAEAAATVLGYIAYTFGPEVLEWVMENPEEALEQFVSWYEKYGERTWAMILVYLEELGVIDAAEDLYSCIEDALADLYEQLEDCTDEAYADIMEQIEVLRAQLDALRAEIEAAASELNAAIYEQLMKGLDEIDALLNELEAIVKGEVEASIEEIKALIAELNAAIEDLLKTIANDVEGTVQGAIQAAVEAIKEQLSYIDGAAEWLEEAVAEAYEAFIDALLEALPYIDEALYDFFYNNPDKVIAFFEENGEFFAENADAVLAVLGYIAVEFGDDALEYVLNNPEEALEQFVSWYEKYGERTWAMILVYLEKLGVLECLPTEEDVKAAIEAIEKQIEDCYKQLETVTGEAVEELEAAIEELKAAVEELKAMVEDYAQMLDAAVRAEIEAAIEKLENAVAELEAAVEELKAAIEAQIEEAIAKAKAAVKEALAKVEEAIAKVEAAVNGVIADVNETIKEVYAALEKAKEELVAGAAQIVENLKDALADLYDVIVENAEKIDAAVLAEIIAAIEDIEEALDKLEAIIKGAADAAIEDVAAELKSALAELQDAVEALIEAVEDNADEIIEEAVAAFEQAYLDATTDEYTITKDSYYVAIGDETVLAEPSYADMLAEALEVEYTKIGEEGLTVAGTEAVLMQNIAEIVKADLITLGYSNNTMISFMIDQATSLMPEELDWSVYGYDELGEYVDAALSDITEELYAQGLDAQTAGLMVTAIESYAFAYTGYMVGYPMVVEAIHEINPDALVIMVGMNNALTDVILEAEGVEIELGEYVQYLVDAANIESLAYAMLTGNAIYVDAPAVETLLEAYDVELGTDMITVLQLLAFPQNRALLNPSEAGHDYIKEQILNALELKYDYLLGDVNLDGDVNSADTNLLFRFVMKRLPEGFTALQMWAGDVNEDGEVNSADTNLLFRYVMKYIPALGAQAQ